MAKKNVAKRKPAKAKKQTKAKKQAEPVDEFSEYVEGVENPDNCNPTVEDLLSDWRHWLESDVEKYKTKDPLRSRQASEALHYLAIIQYADYPRITIFEATIQLGKCFQKMKFRPLIDTAMSVKKGRATGGENSAELKSSKEVLLLQVAYAKNRHYKDWLKRIANELFKNGIVSKRKLKRDRNPDQAAQAKPLSERTISRKLQELGISDNSTVVRGQQ